MTTMMMSFQHIKLIILPHACQHNIDKTVIASPGCIDMVSCYTVKTFGIWFGYSLDEEDSDEVGT